MERKNTSDGQETFFLEGNGSRVWIRYDRATETVFNDTTGITVHISEKRLDDFLGTARELGFKTGRL